VKAPRNIAGMDRWGLGDSTSGCRESATRFVAGKFELLVDVFCAGMTNALTGATKPKWRGKELLPAPEPGKK
jgi:hypothetical protein